MDRRGISTGLATHAETPRGAEPCGGAGRDRRKKGSQPQKRSRHSSTLMSACNEHKRQTTPKKKKQKRKQTPKRTNTQHKHASTMQQCGRFDAFNPSLPLT